MEESFEKKAENKGLGKISEEKEEGQVSEEGMAGLGYLKINRKNEHHSQHEKLGRQEAGTTEPTHKVIPIVAVVGSF